MRAWLSRNRKWALWGIIAAAGLAVYGLVALYSQPEEAARGQPEAVRRHVLERQRQAEAALEARRQALEELVRWRQEREELAQLRQEEDRLQEQLQELPQQRETLAQLLQDGEARWAMPPERAELAKEGWLQTWRAQKELAQLGEALEAQQMLDAAFDRMQRQIILEADLYRLVYEQVAQLAPGKIVFNPPAEMRVGVKERITVRIARDTFEGDIKANLAGRGAPQVEAVEVGTFMRVRLFGDGFTVRSLTDEGQLVPEGRFAEWLFEVRPEASGRRMLELLVTVRIKLPSGEEPVNLPVLRREITVQVNPWWTISQLFAKHWQWFLGGLASVVVAVIGYFGRRWLEDWRSRRASKSGKPPATPGESKPPDTQTPPSDSS